MAGTVGFLRGVANFGVADGTGHTAEKASIGVWWSRVETDLGEVVCCGFLTAGGRLVANMVAEFYGSVIAVEDGFTEWVKGCVCEAVHGEGTPGCSCCEGCYGGGFRYLSW
ncbi:hypothetical protein NC653_016616 [Populus alba x Populus x berolinensis]|uniref:Uncharacterized protein n=2 Tax=Populus TaxID=3689 RepID=A0A4U5QQD6_POPAL|nr:hypothetical protein NC653_016616 [Populus alba x Populus x berolinensis]TKS13058.1 hypothetical protein D5086_0000053710 [Populus alba]